MKHFIAAFSAALLLVAPAAFAQEAHVQGSLETGPTGQGECSAAGTDSFLCSNGAFCSWEDDVSHFHCVGGTGAVEETTSSSSDGPPGRTCTAHEGHYDCEDGSFCEQVDGASSQCNGIDLGEYNMDLHIVALFVVLVSSLLGVLLPLFSANLMSKALFSGIFFAAKHFGTGIILSTAFVHLLYHAFVMFSNACLGELAFEPAAAAISLAGVYVVFGVDFFVMRWLKTRTANREHASAAASADGPQSSPSPSVNKHAEAFGHSHGPAPNEHTDFASPQAHFDVLILEAGIIFHSIMIGVSLGASGGSQWTPLFIAIVFHQLFEGLALGSRIGQLIWPAGQGYRKWVMAAAFGLITPIGIAIGMGVHSGYNPNSGAALLSIGVLDSISAGILLYAGLVEMLYHDFMHGQLAHARMLKVLAAFFFLLAGSLCMSVLGKWA
ncbi:hypothetical protein JCM8097_005350 [Rhodosporidiobolus ruineniae]